MNVLKLCLSVNMYMLYICFNVIEFLLFYWLYCECMIFIWPGMKLIKWLCIVNNNKYVQTIYLVGIKCKMNLLVTKVTKFIRLFNFKLMIISITHKIIDAKLYDYWFMGNWNMDNYMINGYL